MADMLSQDEINALLAQEDSDEGDLGDLGGLGDLESSLAPEPAPAQQPAPVATPAAVPVSQPVVQAPPQPSIPKGDISNLNDVPLRISAFLGKTKMPLKEALKISKDSIVELNKMRGELIDIYVNNQLFAHGEVVVVDEKFGVKIKRIIELSERENLLKKL
jgi:flagellar motor switch protein FliN/FliY